MINSNVRPKLLASAPSLADCVKLVERYWYSRPGACVPLKIGTIQWRVWKNDVEMLEFRIVQKGLRFRFEYVGGTE